MSICQGLLYVPDCRLFIAVFARNAEAIRDRHKTEAGDIKA